MTVITLYPTMSCLGQIEEIHRKMLLTPTSLRQLFGDDAALPMALRPGRKIGQSVRLVQTREMIMVKDGRLGIYVKYDDLVRSAQLCGLPGRHNVDFSKVTLEIHAPNAFVAA